MNLTNARIPSALLILGLLAGPACAQTVSGIPVTTSRTATLVAGHIPMATGPHTLGDSGMFPGSRQVNAQTSTAQQATNSTSYYPCQGITSAANLAEISAKQPWAISGTFRNLHALVDVAPGAVLSDTFTVRVNGASTGLACAISGTDRSCADTNHTVSILAGDTCDVQVVTSLGSMPSRMHSSSEFDN
jgi:hypothetical protein